MPVSTGERPLLINNHRNAYLPWEKRQRRHSVHIMCCEAVNPLTNSKILLGNLRPDLDLREKLHWMGMLCLASIRSFYPNNWLKYMEEYYLLRLQSDGSVQSCGKSWHIQPLDRGGLWTNHSVKVQISWAGTIWSPQHVRSFEGELLSSSEAFSSHDNCTMGLPSLINLVPPNIVNKHSVLHGRWGMLVFWIVEVHICAARNAIHRHPPIAPWSGTRSRCSFKPGEETWMNWSTWASVIQSKSSCLARRTHSPCISVWKKKVPDFDFRNGVLLVGNLPGRMQHIASVAWVGSKNLLTQIQMWATPFMGKRS